MPLTAQQLWAQGSNDKLDSAEFEKEQASEVKKQKSTRKKKESSSTSLTSPIKTAKKKSKKKKGDKESKTTKSSSDDKKKKIKRSSKSTRVGLVKQTSDETASVKTASTASTKQSEESIRERSRTSSRERRATRSRSMTGSTNPSNKDEEVLNQDPNELTAGSTTRRSSSKSGRSSSRGRKENGEENFSEDKEETNPTTPQLTRRRSTSIEKRRSKSSDRKKSATAQAYVKAIPPPTPTLPQTDTLDVSFFLNGFPTPLLSPNIGSPNIGSPSKRRMQKGSAALMRSPPTAGGKSSHSRKLSFSTHSRTCGFEESMPIAVEATKPTSMMGLQPSVRDSRSVPKSLRDFGTDDKVDLQEQPFSTRRGKRGSSISKQNSKADRSISKSEHGCSKISRQRLEFFLSVLSWRSSCREESRYGGISLATRRACQ